VNKEKTSQDVFTCVCVSVADVSYRARCTETGVASTLYARSALSARTLSSTIITATTTVGRSPVTWRDNFRFRPATTPVAVMTSSSWPCLRELVDPWCMATSSTRSRPLTRHRPLYSSVSEGCHPSRFCREIPLSGLSDPRPVVILVVNKLFTIAGPFQLPAPSESGTLCRILSGTRPSVQTVSDVCLRRICLLDTSAFSALKVLDDYCAI